MYLQMKKEEKGGERLRMEPRFAVTEGQHLSEDSDPKPAQKENWKAVNQFQSCWKGRNIF